MLLQISARGFLDRASLCCDAFFLDLALAPRAPLVGRFRDVLNLRAAGADVPLLRVGVGIHLLGIEMVADAGLLGVSGLLFVGSRPLRDPDILHRAANRTFWAGGRTFEQRETRMNTYLRNGEQRNYGTKDVFASGLGWFSIGLGLAEIFASREIARLIGVRNRPAIFAALGARILWRTPARARHCPGP